MKITKSSLLQKAKEIGRKGLSNMGKADIIHALQVAEGNSPCFHRIPDCGVQDCIYRSECIG